MNIAVFVCQNDRWEADRIIEEAEVLGHGAELFFYDEISESIDNDEFSINIDLDKPDIVIFRSSRDGKRKYFTVANLIRDELLERGKFVFNYRGMKNYPFDKFTQQQILLKAKIPGVESYVVSNLSEIEKLIESRGELVAKPLYGSSGDRVELIKSVKQVGDLKIKLNEFVFQEVMEKGRDYRVVVVGGMAIGAMERVAKRGEFVTNYSVGGAVYEVELKKSEILLAEKAAKVCNLEYAGVDLIRDKGGEMRVLEINRFAQYQGFEKATGINVARIIVEYCVKNCIKRAV